MRTERTLRVDLVEGTPGPSLLMARAYSASVAAFVLRTPIRWVFVLSSVGVVFPLPVRFYLAGKGAQMVAIGVAIGMVLLVVTVALSLAFVTLLWSLFYMYRRATRPSWVWVATRGSSTAALWAEKDHKTGNLYVRFWGSFPGGIGGAVLHEMIRWADERDLTVDLHARTDSLTAMYARLGFLPCDETDFRGRPLLRRAPKTGLASRDG